MNNRYEHVVRTYNASGKNVYAASFETAEKAYTEYLDIVDNAKRTLPKGYAVTVVRYRNGNEMHSETVIGTH